LKLMELIAPIKASLAPADKYFEDPPEEGQIPTENHIANPVPEPLQGVKYVDPYSDSAIQKSTSEEEQQKSSSCRGCGSAAPPPDERKASEYVARLVSRLEVADIPLLKGMRDRYGREFREALRRGVEHSVLEKAVDRIAQRWLDPNNHYKLTVDMAVADVVSGKDDKARVRSGKDGKARARSVKEDYEWLFD
jgi:hypothetical protein